MNHYLTHNPRTIFLLVALIWTILFAIVTAAIVLFDIHRAKQELVNRFNNDYQQVSHRILVNESVLEGFAAMVSSTHDSERTRIRNYAKKMLSQYPHLFMFEIVETVTQEKLQAFSDYYRKNVYPEFEVRAFSFQTDRQWQPVKPSAVHLPIVFMEPFPPESRKVLGLDLSSNDFFMRSLEKAKNQNRSVASDPFTLIEGELAYLIHRPILATDSVEQLYQQRDALGGFAMLVIRAETLLDRDAPAASGMRELLYNPDYSDTDARGYLYLQETPEVGWLASRLLPFISISKVLNSASQPFKLLVEQQLNWDVISWGTLAFTLMITLSTFAVMIMYARIYMQNELERTHMTERLLHLANHDVLTGLANRNLLYDRLDHALSQSDRHKKRLALLFMDLKEFKSVNDTYGHDVGDEVLKAAASRLRQCVRAGDTLARLGGDEFVLVQENINSQEDVRHLMENIKTTFEQPFTVHGHLITLGISIGSAQYPGDGKDINSLILKADFAMYADKRSTSQRKMAG